ncbi:hypothetical protein M758_10G117400, partial [Ceratodon purpureus]
MHLEVPLRSKVMVGMHWKWPCLSTLQTLHPMLSPTRSVVSTFIPESRPVKINIFKSGSFFLNQEMLGQSQAH